MVFHMKTTLVIDDDVMRRLKARAALEGRTLSSLVEAYLRRGLQDDEGSPGPPSPIELPRFDMGVPRVDGADREAVDAAIEAHDRARR